LLGARTRSLLVAAVAIVIALAAVPAAGAHKAKKPPKPKDHTYQVDFIGSGTWVSDENDAVEGVNQCSNATDDVNESDDLKWDVAYQFTVPAKGDGPAETPKGTYFKAGDATWQQLSTVTPRGCLGGNQDCAGKLYPASADNPPVIGYDKRPESVFKVDSDDVTVGVQSVLDWVVADPTGSSTCSLYAHYHSALEPFALAKQLHATTKTVAAALSAFTLIPRSKLDGRSYTKEIKPDPSAQPLSSCQSYTIDAISCVETLHWSGKLEFRADG
jgi:hypothetical protein